MLKQSQLFDYYKMPSNTFEINTALKLIKYYGDDSSKYPVEIDDMALGTTRIIRKIYGDTVSCRPAFQPSQTSLVFVSII